MPSVINGFYSVANCFSLLPFVQFICKFFATPLMQTEVENIFMREQKQW